MVVVSQMWSMDLFVFTFFLKWSCTECRVLPSSRAYYSYLLQCKKKVSGENNTHYDTQMQSEHHYEEPHTNYYNEKQEVIKCLIQCFSVIQSQPTDWPHVRRCQISTGKLAGKMEILGETVLFSQLSFICINFDIFFSSLSCLPPSSSSFFMFSFILMWIKQTYCD